MEDKMFHSFESRQARQAFGGSAFIEIQYCRLNPAASIREIASLGVRNDWKDDSLYVYVDDMDEFYSNYKDIFRDGTHNNTKKGDIDLFGINYYSPKQLTEIIDRIEKQKPLDYEILLKWLKQAFNYNGFYILGI
jgi:hypothetical protein